jgi:hypothetical protein
MQGPAPIPVFRPSKLTDGPEFQGSLVESPANIFYQKVTASRATLNRIQFQWRSVSDNLLVSPIARVRFKLKISCPQLWTQITAALSCAGRVGNIAGATQILQLVGGGGTKITGSAPSPCIVFADGDAFTNCCSSINLQFNGTSLSLNRTNRFWRDYQRTQLSSDDSARIYKCAGGGYDKFDKRPVALLPTLDYANGGGQPDHAGAAGKLSQGYTQDSGITERSKALYASACTHIIGADQMEREVWVSYPVPVPPLNPWHGYVLPASCPYKNGSLAIPHFSAGGLDFLMEDFAKSFIRRLGGSSVAGAGAALLTGAQNAAAVAVTMGDAKDCILELKYFRLSHTRTLKESYRFNVWQTQTFNGPEPRAALASGHIATGHAGDAYVGMAPVGRDHASAAAVATNVSQISANPDGKTWTFDFDALNLAQVPSFLLISCPRLSESYTLGDDSVVGSVANCIRNLSRNLSIIELKIVVNSARGAIDIDGTDQTGFVNAERLFEMTQENSGSHYFKSGGFRAWRDYGCAVLLNSTQFAPGLQVCDGVAYPIQIQITMKVANKNVDLCPEKLIGQTLAPAGVIGTAAKNVPALCADVMRARAQCTCFFTKVVLATTETSATTNAMNYPLDSAERLLNSAGQMR